MKRLAISILVGVFVVSLLVILFLAGTEPGLRILLPVIKGFAPKELSIGEVRGRLIGPLAITGLRYHGDTVTINIETLQFDWRPRSLLAGTFSIQACDAGDVRVEMRKGEEKPPELPEIDLFLDVSTPRCTVKQITVTREGWEEPVVIDEVSFAVKSRLNTIHIEELKANSGLFSLDIAGRLTPLADYPLDLTTQWSVRPEGYAPFTGEGRLNGSMKDLRITQKISEPLEGALRMGIREVLLTPLWDGDVVVKKANPRNISKDLPDVALSGRMRGEGRGEEFRMAGSMKASIPAMAELSAEVSAEKKGNVLHIQRLSLAVPGTKAKAELSGEYRRSEGRNLVKLSGRWSDLSWPLVKAPPIVESPEGSFNAEGWLDGFQATINASLSGEDVPPARITLSGRGDTEAFEVSRVHASTLKGNLEGKGWVRWAPGLSWQFSLKGKDLDPSVVWKEWPGSISLDADTAGSVKDGKPRYMIDIGSSDGRLRGFPFSAVMKIETDGERYDLSRLLIKSGTARVGARGSVGQQWDMSWEVRAPDLKALFPGLGGVLDGHGTLRGPRAAPVVVATLKGRDINGKEVAIKGLDADLSVDVSDAADSRVQVQGRGIRTSFARFDAISLKVGGRLSGHRMDITGSGPLGSFSSALQGIYKEKIWKGSLDRGDMDLRDLGKWTLQSSAPLGISQDNAQVGRLCWVQGGSTVCAEGLWQRDGISSGKVTLREIPLSFIPRLAGTDLKVSGKAGGDARIEISPKGQVDASLKLRASEGTVSYPLSKKESLSLHFRSIDLEGGIEKEVLRAKVDVPLTDGGFLKGSLGVRNFSLPRATERKEEIEQGSIKAELRDLRFIPVLFPEVRNVSGRLVADLRLTGSLAQPGLAGEVSISGGEAEVPRMGIHLKDIMIAASSDGTKAAKIRGEAGSGPGTISLDGQVMIARAEGWPIDLRIRGENFEMLRIPEARVLVSPSLGLSLRGRKAEVSGELRIPEARLEPRDFSGAVRPSADVVIVDRPQEKREEDAFEIRGKVRVSLGDRVSFSGFGLIGRLTGTVVAVEEPGRPTAATGRIEILDGRYEAYGQKLEIERGSLIFAGPVDNPGIDLRAARKTGEVVAGVTVMGSLREPRMSLYSRPPMDQSDALSYLLLGRPVNRASAEEGKMLQNAARSLALSGGDYLAKRIGGLFGIEEIGIEGSEGIDDAALFIGKYLSPRLYVGYGLGLFTPSNTFRLRYDLTKRLKILVESGTESGADILYTIER